MKTIHYLVLLVLAWGMQLTRAQEPRFTAGQTFTLRIAGVPAEDAAQVSGVKTISSSGTISMTYLKGEIMAAGLTPTELQRKIANAYISNEIYTQPDINIQTNGVQQIEQVITVGGEVRIPAEVPFRPGLNLYAAITKAGGPTEYGDMRKVKLIRNKTERIFDLRKVTSENNPELQVGDQIVVPGG
jgi:polysaccharide biosynthesis/export protein